MLGRSIKIKIFVLLAVISGLITGCVSSRIAYYADPKFPKIGFKRIVVNCIERGLIKKKEAEMAFVRILSKRAPNTVFLPSTEFLHPTRDYKTDEICDILYERGVDGYLVVDFMDERYRTTAAGIILRSDDMGFAFDGIDKVITDYTIDLIEVKSGSCVWTANSEVKVSLAVPADYVDMIESMVKKVSEAMLSLGYIR